MENMVIKKTKMKTHWIREDLIWICPSILRLTPDRRAQGERSWDLGVRSCSSTLRLAQGRRAQGDRSTEV